jgi:hypothetical protein
LSEANALFRRAGEFVDKILRGTGQVWAVDPPSGTWLLTLTTANRMATICGFREYVEVGALMSLGLAIPESFLLRADELIE